MTGDTIAAVATAGGVASIAIIRISGPLSVEIAGKIAPGASFEPRKAELLSIYNNNRILIDKAIVLYFASPRSFTGEDIVEFQCHGGMIVAEEILDTAMAYGARLAEPGEFSRRAFLNGKIDLSEAEAIAGLIEARSTDAARILARLVRGDLKDFIEDIRTTLTKMLAYSEVMIDYAEEDIPAETMEKLHRSANVAVEKIERIVSSSERRRGLIEGFRVAIIGKPNVGKSSLLNALLNYERAIVSNIPGTTRDTIEEQIRIGSHIIRVIDTAGIREASDEVEKIGVERSMSSISGADLIIALFDYSSPADEEDAAILELLRNLKDKNIIVVLNKSDLVRRFDESVLADFNPLYLSVKKSTDVLLNEIKKILDGVEIGDDLMLVSARQTDAAREALREIRSSLTPLAKGELEFFSYHISEALKSISSITRPCDNEEILDRMFGDFCLGK